MRIAAYPREWSKRMAASTRGCIGRWGMPGRNLRMLLSPQCKIVSSHKMLTWSHFISFNIRDREELFAQVGKPKVHILHTCHLHPGSSFPPR